MPHYVSGELAVRVTTASGPFLGGNPRRHAILLTSHNTDSYTISSYSPVVLGSGITVIAGVQPFVLRYSDMGDWIRRPLQVIATGTAVIHVIEVLEAD